MNLSDNQRSALSDIDDLPRDPIERLLAVKDLDRRTLRSLVNRKLAYYTASGVTIRGKHWQTVKLTTAGRRALET